MATKVIKYKGVNIYKEEGIIWGWRTHWRIDLEIRPVSSKPVKKPIIDVQRFETLQQAKDRINMFY